jgi:hypothetical protein
VIESANAKILGFDGAVMSFVEYLYELGKWRSARTSDRKLSRLNWKTREVLSQVSQSLTTSQQSHFLLCKDVAVAAADCGHYKYWTSANDFAFAGDTPAATAVLLPD